MNALRTRIFTQTLNRKSILKSLALSTTLTAATTTSITLCEQNDDQNDIINKIKSIASSSFNIDQLGQALGNTVNDAIATGVPTEISYGFVCGFSSGFALKKIGKVASVVFGLGFVTLQSLSYAGYVQVDHALLQKNVEKALDLNKDGMVDKKDADQALNKVMEVLQFGMNGGAGFAAGFFGGFRSG
jgi:uncharacterized membrane protein (Fun14 family)